MEDRFKFRAFIQHSKEVCEVFRIGFEMMNGTEIEYMDEVGDHLIAYNEQAILMQCTGLRDKNGKLIYEGDLMRWRDFEDETNKIYFDSEQAAFAMTGGINYGEIPSPDYLEVIGNIYENPELLKEV